MFDFYYDANEIDNTVMSKITLHIYYYQSIAKIKKY